MLARLYVALPFQIAIPEGAEFPVYKYEDDGTQSRFLCLDQLTNRLDQFRTRSC